MPPSAQAPSHPPAVVVSDPRCVAEGGDAVAVDAADAADAAAAAGFLSSSHSLLPYNNNNINSNSNSNSNIELATAATAAASAAPSMYNPGMYNSMSPYGGNAMMGGVGYGAGYGGGMGMYGGGYGTGGYGNMMYGGGGGGGPMLSGLNQFLFGVQNVIFSLSQAVQIVGMNTDAVQQLFAAGAALCTRAVTTWREMRAIEAAAHRTTTTAATETPDARRRRRRLRALRWMFVASVSWAGYQVIRKLMGHWLSFRQQRQLVGTPAPPPSSSYPPQNPFL